MKKIEIIYCESYKDDLLDMGEGFLSRIYNDEHPNGTTHTYFPLCERVKGDPEEGADYIHCDILRELVHMSSLGYEIDLSRAVRPDRVD